MQVHRTNKVFIPGGLPDITYVPRTERNLESRLRQADDNLCKLVTLTGPTKCGKTVLTGRVFPRKDVIWLDGGVFPNETSLWSEVNDQLEAFTDHEQSNNKGSQTEIQGEFTGEGGIPLLKGNWPVGRLGRGRTSVSCLNFYINVQNQVLWMS